MEPATKTRLATVAETGLGIVLALVPVALLVAWTPWIWVIVVAVGAVAAALLVAVGYWLPHADEGASGAGPKLPDEAIAAIHEVFPLTYHHSFRQPARFRRAMDALRRVL
jgi:hypothetical protein